MKMPLHSLFLHCTISTTLFIHPTYMSTEQKAMTTQKQQPIPTHEVERVKGVMETSSVMLAAKSQQQINALKDITNHFYVVGRYKATDAQGNEVWLDKKEPDAFALQTLATVQKVSSETLSVEWENPNDLKKAAVKVRVRVWKGKKETPTIERTVELRYSMQAIAMKYVMDKLEAKSKWNAKTRKKEVTNAEWSEDSVQIFDNGWVEPKAATEKIKMLSYLTDQYTFLDRTAETKAERRANLKILGFDWRDPDEISSETGERLSVQKAKSAEIPQAAFELMARIDSVSNQEQYDAISKECDQVANNYEKHVYDLIVSKLSTKLTELSAGVAAAQEEKEDQEEKDTEGKEEAPEEAGEQQEMPLENKGDDVPYPDAATFQRYQINLRNAKTEDGLRTAYEPIKPVPLTEQQKKSIRVTIKQKLQAFKTAQKLSVTAVTDNEINAVMG